MTEDPPLEGAAELEAKHGDDLLRFAAGRTRNRADAEDVVQDTFGVALERPVPETSPRPWLFRVAFHKLLKLAARARRRREAPLSDVDLASRAPGPAVVLDALEERARVAAAVAALPDEQAAVIRLFYEEGLSHREIASRLSVPATTVQSRLRSALEALRGKLVERRETRP